MRVAKQKTEESSRASKRKVVFFRSPWVRLL